MTLAKVRWDDTSKREQDGMTLAKAKEQDGMTLAKEDGMTLAKVKEQDGMTLKCQVSLHQRLNLIEGSCPSKL